MDKQTLIETGKLAKIRKRLKPIKKWKTKIAAITKRTRGSGNVSESYVFRVLDENDGRFNADVIANALKVIKKAAEKDTTLNKSMDEILDMPGDEFEDDIY